VNGQNIAEGMGKYRVCEIGLCSILHMQGRIQRRRGECNSWLQPGVLLGYGDGTDLLLTLGGA
jgi:hypothetical protein